MAGKRRYFAVACGIGFDAEVMKEDNVFPMIPAGAALRDMIIERPKQKMAKPEGST
jgi:acetolactate synthase-1/2/3 large subunit